MHIFLNSANNSCVMVLQKRLGYYCRSKKARNQYFYFQLQTTVKMSSDQGSRTETHHAFLSRGPTPFYGLGRRSQTTVSFKNNCCRDSSLHSCIFVETTVSWVPILSPWFKGGSLICIVYPKFLIYRSHRETCKVLADTL